jgi:hypothetical protein
MYVLLHGMKPLVVWRPKRDVCITSWYEAFSSVAMSGRVIRVTIGEGQHVHLRGDAFLDFRWGSIYQWEDLEGSNLAQPPNLQKYVPKIRQRKEN